MITKHLAIAAAIIFLAGAGASEVLAQTPPPASTTAQPSGAPAGAPGAGSMAAPGQQPAAAPSAPATPPPAATDTSKPAAAPAENPYGFTAFVKNSDWVLRAVLLILGIMSIGTWYIFFTKYWDQSRVLGQSRVVDRRFWSSANLNEGIDKLPKNSLFRSVAEGGVRAASGQGTGLVNLNDWISMSLNRQLEEANGKMQGGIAFLASTGSTAPFVGLFGTVWGILNALIQIGLAGQASIDKVAGPVGQALIATALGLAVAVPAVLCYNYLVRRNKVINEKLRSFASDLQTYLITNKK
ncbi:MAG: MotA/TolQ/ExbB proton channel family protein [Rhizomicrobium sp.]|jgi:biopolymer transport protein ExbB